VTNLAVPVPRTFVVGEVETAAYFNTSVRDTSNFLLGVPIATVYQTLSQSLTSGAATPVTFDSTAVDTYGGHSNTVSPSRYTAQVAGWYLVGGAAPMAGSGSGTYRKLQIWYNGAAVAYATSELPPPSTSAAAVTPALSPTIIYMNVGDFVGVYATADTSGVSVTPNTANEAYMTVVWAHL
jgi:hypothetical protein